MTLPVRITFIKHKVGQPAGCPTCFLWVANSLSQNLTVLTAPSGREPLARPQTLHFSRELYRSPEAFTRRGKVARSAG